MKEPERDSQWGVSLRDTFDWTHFVLYSLALLVLPFLRSGMGSAMPGVAGAIAFVIVLPVFAAFAESNFILTYYWKMWLAMVLYRRIETAVINWRRRRSGQRWIHSQYEGYPWLAGRLFFWVADEAKLKRNEPIICFAIGVLCLPLEEAFGKFLMGAALALMLLDGLYSSIRRKREIARNDTAIEFELEADMHQSMR